MQNQNMSSSLHPVQRSKFPSSLSFRVKLALGLFIVLIVVTFVINYRDSVASSKKAHESLTTLDPQQQQSSDSIEEEATAKREYIYHINFADGCCKEAQKRNCQLAQSKGAVDKCLMFDMSVLDEEFKEKNKEILSRKRGAGYWLWKPYIILHTMVNIAKPDDYIIYTDADRENKEPFIASNNKIKKLLDTQNIVVFPMGFAEGNWTKRDAFVLMGMDSDPEIKSSGQINAAMIIVKNSFKAQRFIGEWLTYMQDPRASTDDANTFGLANDSGFKDHRHDQSVLSLLTKKWKLNLHGLKSDWHNYLVKNKYGRQ